MSKNLVESESAQMKIWRRVACWINKTTRVKLHSRTRAATPTTPPPHPPTLTHLDICDTSFPIQQWFRERASALHCFSLFFVWLLNRWCFVLHYSLHDISLQTAHPDTSLVVLACTWNIFFQIFYLSFNNFTLCRVEMDLREVGWGGMDWINLAQDRDRWRVLVNGYEPSGSIKCGEFLE
jgi:hypothetical protein